jgi:sn-glycerol 3-phosphate transport system substrate-binding protein
MHRRAFLASAAAVSAGPLGCATDQAPPGRVVVPFWFMYGGRNRTTLETLVGRFNRSQSDVWVRSIFQGDYFEGLAKLRTALAAGAAPPLSHVIGEVVPYLAEAGMLEALDDYPDAKTLPIHPALGQAGSFREGAEHPLVIVPFNRSTPIAYLNGRLFQELGARPPETWDELGDVARQLTRPGRFGFGCPTDWWFWAALVGQAGGEVVDAHGQVTLGGAAGVAALELWQRLVSWGVMKPPPGRDFNAWEQLSQDFLAGRVAMMWSSTAFVRYLQDTADFPVLASPLPRGVRAAVPTGGTHFVILKQVAAELKQAAWRFVRYLLEVEPAAFWSSETGYLPVTTSAVTELRTSGFYAKHPNFEVALRQLAVAQPWPWSKGLFRIQREIVQPRLEAAVLERQSPILALREARKLAQESGL